MMKNVILMMILFYIDDKNNDLDYINDDGEKGLQLIGLILRIHTNRLVNTSLYEKIFSFLRSKKENISKFKSSLFVFFLFFYSNCLFFSIH